MIARDSSGGLHVENEENKQAIATAIFAISKQEHMWFTNSSVEQLKDTIFRHISFTGCKPMTVTNCDFLWSIEVFDTEITFNGCTIHRLEVSLDSKVRLAHTSVEWLLIHDTPKKNLLNLWHWLKVAKRIHPDSEAQDTVKQMAHLSEQTVFRTKHRLIAAGLKAEL